MKRRIFLIVLDSVGIGEAADAAAFGDAGSHTVRSVSRSEYFEIPNLLRLGLGNISGLSFLGKSDVPSASYARVCERSNGKDTTIGHWEIAGLESPNPLPTYPNGFPQALLDRFSEACGRGVLCNLPYSGTEVIRDYGEEHLRTGKLIVYTSADSVFQIAAHESVVPVEELYRICRIARSLLVGSHAVGRVIARPFTGTCRADFSRTANRRDFSLEPTGKTVLDALQEAGRDVIGVGKIYDIFAGRGITEHVLTHGNQEGMQCTLALTEKQFNGLCFVNLVDFDMIYGHRNDVDGYAKALSAFDAWLPSFLNRMREDDILMITADHGCDPGDISTDHTRENVPLLVYGKQLSAKDLGTRATYADLAASIAQWLDVPYSCGGTSFVDLL